MKVAFGYIIKWLRNGESGQVESSLGHKAQSAAKQSPGLVGIGQYRHRHGDDRRGVLGQRRLRTEQQTSISAKLQKPGWSIKRLTRNTTNLLGGQRVALAVVPLDQLLRADFAREPISEQGAPC